MKTSFGLSAFLLAMGVPGLGLAQQPLKPPEAVKESVGDQIVKKLEFVATPLPDAIDFLKDCCHGFQAVIVPDPRYPSYVPVLPTMNLRDLPLSQIVDVMKKSDLELAVDKVSSAKGDVWVFHIRRGNDVRQPEPPSSARPVVEVFRLSPLIPKTASDRSKALNDILSLLQAVVDASGPSNLMMKVHAPTETLILRGNPTELDMIIRALAPLQEAQAEKNFEAEAQRESATLQAKDAEIARLRAELEKARAEAKAQAAGIAPKGIEAFIPELEKQQQLRGRAEKAQQVPAENPAPPGTNEKQSR